MISHTVTALAMIVARCFWTGAVFYAITRHFLINFSIVGMARFELTTTRPPDVDSTGLNYIPKGNLMCKDTTFFSNYQIDL